MIRWYVDNRSSHGGRRPQRHPCQLADQAGAAAGPGRRSVRPGGAPTARLRVVLGLLADLPRKNCWTLAEHAGQATPTACSTLLARSVWDHDRVRDDVRDVRDYLVEHLADPAAVLVVDETGDLKKGTRTVWCNARTPAPPARSTTPRSPAP
jgi:hypothetical protein